MGKSESAKILEMIFAALKENPELLKLAKTALGIAIDPKKPLPWAMFLKNGQRVPEQTLAAVGMQVKEKACLQIEDYFKEKFSIVFDNREDLKFVLKKYVDSLQ